MQLKLEQITGKGESKLETLWEEYQTVLANYGQHIEGFYSEYVDLKQRDEESAQLISQQSYEIEHLIEQLSNLRLLAEEQQTKQQAQLEHRQSIKQQLTDRFRELRECVDLELETQHKLFKQMSVESHEVIEALKGILSKGETLMQLARICSKMETQREKMFLLPQLSREIIEIRELQSPTEETISDPLKEEVASLPQMETFWRRVNNVAVDVACLKQQKRNLEAANAQLKSELQDYLINLNISHGSNSHIQSYLSRRPKSMSVDRVTQLRLQPKQVKSAMATAGGGRRPLPRPHGEYVPRCEANISSTIRSRSLIRGKPQLAKIQKQSDLV
ncbi:hypothetical protein ACLKA6_003810 [Drosophila palustris]